MATAHAQTLFTYGNKAVSKQEFVNAFDKNPSTDTTNRQQALQDYLQLYIHYKLKVQAAYDERLNETDQYKSETENFIREIAQSAIDNEAGINELIKEAFVRGQKDIRLSQVFIPVMPGNDTATAFAQIESAYQMLNQGTTFTDVVNHFSPNPSAKNNNGSMGFVTVFTLPYEVENIVYGLQPGRYSAPYHSNIGYHIFRNDGEQPAKGSREVQQILFATSPGASDAEKTAAKHLADSVYRLIRSGAPFADLQATYSQKNNNRTTIEVNVGQYSEDFEKEVYSLQKEGDVSAPFFTAYGYNILKLINRNDALPDTTDMVVKATLQEKIAAGDRLSIARNNLVKQWKTKTGYRPAQYSAMELWRYTDSAINNNHTNSFKNIRPSTVLFSFAKQPITVSDWLKFVQLKMGEGKEINNYASLMPQFVEYATTNYYKQHIATFHPELKPQIDDFKDANLLFAAMDKHVWSKAVQDTAGLLDFYRNHQANYTWAPGADAIIVNAGSKEIATEIAAKIKQHPADWKMIADAYGSLAQADSSRFERDQLPLNKEVSIQEGFLSDIVPLSGSAGYSFVYITKLHPQSETRNFEDARGMVINDYQQVVENQWIQKLKQKYPVNVNESVWKMVR